MRSGSWEVHGKRERGGEAGTTARDVVGQGNSDDDLGGGGRAERDTVPVSVAHSRAASPAYTPNSATPFATPVSEVVSGPTGHVRVARTVTGKRSPSRSVWGGLVEGDAGPPPCQAPMDSPTPRGAYTARKKSPVS